MYFLIDGYNLLFSWLEDQKGSIETKRAQLVHWIQHEFTQLNLRGMIIFDGAHRRDEESGLSYPSPMEVAFTPKGQTADEYILEQLELLKHQKNATLVTNDLGLKRRASVLNAKTLSNNAFFAWLHKHSTRKKNKRSPIKDSPAQIDRLLKIFEQRLQHELGEGN